MLSIFLMAKPVQAQINDLSCVFAETKGTVLLSWTPPVGTNSYDVRYALSAIDAANYNLAPQFPQSWPATATQGYVTNLTEDKNWFFAMKAIDAGGNPSPISNGVYCFLPIKATQGDTVAPTSSITDPKDGATILADNDYIIKGESFDTGGSSVQKVEISFNDGKTWSVTLPKKSISTCNCSGAAIGFTWEYIWVDPILGVYNIKTRATDWWGNQETPRVSIKITVTSQEVEEPGTGMTIEELNQKIIEVQSKIAELLKQVIQILQNQILEVQAKLPG